MNQAVGALVVAILLLWGIAVARAERPPPPGYYDQQLLNYRYTEFCAVMRRPPKSLIEAIDNAFSTEEGKKSPAVIEGFNYIHVLDRMVQERCGDA